MSAAPGKESASTTQNSDQIEGLSPGWVKIRALQGNRYSYPALGDKKYKFKQAQAKDAELAKASATAQDEAKSAKPKLVEPSPNSPVAATGPSSQQEPEREPGSEGEKPVEIHSPQEPETEQKLTPTAAAETQVASAVVMQAPTADVAVPPEQVKLQPEARLRELSEGWEAVINDQRVFYTHPKLGQTLYTFDSAKLKDGDLQPKQAADIAPNPLATLSSDAKTETPATRAAAEQGDEPPTQAESASNPIEEQGQAASELKTVLTQNDIRQMLQLYFIEDNDTAKIDAFNLHTYRRKDGDEKVYSAEDALAMLPVLEKAAKQEGSKETASRVEIPAAAPMTTAATAPAPTSATSVEGNGVEQGLAALSNQWEPLAKQNATTPPTQTRPIPTPLNDDAQLEGATEQVLTTLWGSQSSDEKQVLKTENSAGPVSPSSAEPVKAGEDEAGKPAAAPEQKEEPKLPDGWMKREAEGKVTYTHPKASGLSARSHTGINLIAPFIAALDAKREELSSWNIVFAGPEGDKRLRYQNGEDANAQTTAATADEAIAEALAMQVKLTQKKAEAVSTAQQPKPAAESEQKQTSPTATAKSVERSESTTELAKPSEQKEEAELPEGWVEDKEGKEIVYFHPAAPRISAYTREAVLSIQGFITPLLTRQKELPDWEIVFAGPEGDKRLRYQNTKDASIQTTAATADGAVAEALAMQARLTQEKATAAATAQEPQPAAESEQKTLSLPEQLAGLISSQNEKGLKAFIAAHPNFDFKAKLLDNVGTPLAYAVSKNYWSIVEVLVNKDASSPNYYSREELDAALASAASLAVDDDAAKLSNAYLGYVLLTKRKNYGAVEFRDNFLNIVQGWRERINNEALGKSEQKAQLFLNIVAFFNRILSQSPKLEEAKTSANSFAASGAGGAIRISGDDAKAAQALPQGWEQKANGFYKGSFGVPTRELIDKTESFIEALDANKTGLKSKGVKIVCSETQRGSGIYDIYYQIGDNPEHRATSDVARNALYSNIILKAAAQATSGSGERRGSVRFPVGWQLVWGYRGAPDTYSHPGMGITGVDSQDDIDAIQGFINKLTAHSAQLPGWKVVSYRMPSADGQGSGRIICYQRGEEGTRTTAVTADAAITEALGIQAHLAEAEAEAEALAARSRSEAPVRMPEGSGARASSLQSKGMGPRSLGEVDLAPLQAKRGISAATQRTLAYIAMLVLSGTIAGILAASVFPEALATIATLFTLSGPLAVVIPLLPIVAAGALLGIGLLATLELLNKRNEEKVRNLVVLIASMAFVGGAALGVFVAMSTPYALNLAIAAVGPGPGAYALVTAVVLAITLTAFMIIPAIVGGGRALNSRPKVIIPEPTPETSSKVAVEMTGPSPHTAPTSSSVPISQPLPDFTGKTAVAKASEPTADQGQPLGADQRAARTSKTTS